MVSISSSFTAVFGGPARRALTASVCVSSRSMLSIRTRVSPTLMVSTLDAGVSDMTFCILCCPFASKVVVMPVPPRVISFSRCARSASSSSSASSSIVRSLPLLGVPASSFSVSGSESDSDSCSDSGSTSPVGSVPCCGNPGRCDSHMAAVYVLEMASRREGRPGPCAWPSIWIWWLCPSAVVTATNPGSPPGPHRASVMWPAIWISILRFAFCAIIARVALGAVVMRFLLNGSQVTEISSILARWHAKVNSFLEALFQGRSPASSCSSARLWQQFVSSASLYVTSIICLVPSSNWQHLCRLPHVASNRVPRGSFTWSPPCSFGNVSIPVAVLLLRFHAFLYALSHTAVNVLKSDSGHWIIGPEKARRGGRHMDTTFNAWSILRSSFL